MGGGRLLKFLPQNLGQMTCMAHLYQLTKRTPKKVGFVVKALHTPPKLSKFHTESENDGFQKESPFLGVDFQVPC